MSSLGERIRFYRQTLGLSQLELARLVGSGRAATVSNWERDQTTPERGTLRTLADLSSDPEDTLIWLEYGGTARPKIRRKGETTRYDPTAVSPTRPVPPPGIPDVSKTLDDPGRMLEQLNSFVRRVGTMASLDQPFPKYFMLEIAAMLLKLYEQYSYVVFRLNAVLREMPLVIFELDELNTVVDYHSGTVASNGERVKPEAYRGKALENVLPVIASKEFFQALIEVRDKGVTPEQRFAVAFKDGSRHYTAHLAVLPDRHVLVFVRKAEDARKGELGLKLVKQQHGGRTGRGK